MLVLMVSGAGISTSDSPSCVNVSGVPESHASILVPLGLGGSGLANIFLDSSSIWLKIPPLGGLREVAGVGRCLAVLGSGPRPRFFDNSAKFSSRVAQSISASGGNDFVLDRSDISDCSSGKDLASVSGREYEGLGLSIR